MKNISTCTLALIACLLATPAWAEDDCPPPPSNSSESAAACNQVNISFANFMGQFNKAHRGICSNKRKITKIDKDIEALRLRREMLADESRCKAISGSFGEPASIPASCTDAVARKIHTQVNKSIGKFVKSSVKSTNKSYLAYINSIAKICKKPARISVSFNYLTDDPIGYEAALASVNCGLVNAKGLSKAESSYKRITKLIGARKLRLERFETTRSRLLFNAFTLTANKMTKLETAKTKLNTRNEIAEEKAGSYQYCADSYIADGIECCNKFRNNSTSCNLSSPVAPSC